MLGKVAAGRGWVSKLLPLIQTEPSGPIKSHGWGELAKCQDQHVPDVVEAMASTDAITKARSQGQKGGIPPRVCEGAQEENTSQPT